jgi:hypothetical protein
MGLSSSGGSTNFGATAPTWAENGSVAGLAFDLDAESVHLQPEVPNSWIGSTDLKLKIYWTNEAANAIADTETVIWQIVYRSLDFGAEGASNGTAVTASVTYTQSGAGADGDTHVSEITIDYNHANQPVSVGDVLEIHFSRLFTSDTYAKDAIVCKFELEFDANGISDHT